MLHWAFWHCINQGEIHRCNQAPSTEYSPKSIHCPVQHFKKRITDSVFYAPKLSSSRCTWNLQMYHAIYNHWHTFSCTHEIVYCWLLVYHQTLVLGCTDVEIIWCLITDIAIIHLSISWLRRGTKDT